MASPQMYEGDRHLLLWQVTGESRVEIAGASIVLTAGMAAWIPSRWRHSWVVEANSNLLPMFFPADSPIVVPEHPLVLPVDDSATTACLALVSSYYSLVNPPADLEAIVLALVVGTSGIPDGVRMPSSAPALRVARAVLLDPGNRRTLADWAGVVHLSTRSLERAFRSETGLTWRQWRQSCRMARATQLLAESSTSVTAIAHRVGFDTHSSFTRAFRQHCGISPTEYRLGGFPASPWAKRVVGL